MDVSFAAHALPSAVVSSSIFFYLLIFFCLLLYSSIFYRYNFIMCFSIVIRYLILNHSVFLLFPPLVVLLFVCFRYRMSFFLTIFVVKYLSAIIPSHRSCPAIVLGNGMALRTTSFRMAMQHPRYVAFTQFFHTPWCN